jgi:glycosyltransferase involved in cell wall biosynthesis
MFSGPRPDVTFVYSPPLFLGLTAAVASKIWRRPFVFWVNDLWPQGALWLGFMKEGALYRLACAMERFIYRQAPCILVYSLQRKQELVDKGIDGNKIIHHPLWIDTEVFHPDPKGAAKVRKEYGWGKKFVVLYGGNIGLAQGLDVFVESARLLRDNPEVLFVMVGSGVEKPKLEQLVHNYRLDNIVFVDQQPKEKVGAFFSAADVLFAHLGDAPHRFGTVPEKVLAYMACGRPVLMAAQEGAGSDLVRECRCGMAVPPDNPEAVTQAVLSLLQNRGQLQELGQMGRAAAEAKFAGPKVLKAMEASMAELCSVSR